MNDLDLEPSSEAERDIPVLPVACPICQTTHWPEEPILCRVCGEPVLVGGWAP